ncbi:MAG: AAA family ATPase [Phycisphaeraceae bacterium]
MPSQAPKYSFFSDLARIVNAGQSRSVLVTGDVQDLFFVGDKPSKLDGTELEQGEALAGQYLPLMPYLCKQCDIPGTVVLVYELNGPIRCVDPKDHKQLRQAWITWKTGLSPDHFTLQSLTDPDAGKKQQQLEQSFDQHITDATGKPTVALELLRQLTLCAQHARRHALRNSDGFKLIILIEAADLLMPAGDGDITKLGQADRHRIAIMQDWLSDPGFIEGDDTLIMLAESRSSVHGKVAKLPQVLSVSVPSPDENVRRHYLDWFANQREQSGKTKPMIDDRDKLAALTAGLSIHALRQLLVQSAYSQEPITADQVIAQVESYILGQLGEDVVAFSKPAHTLDQVVGYTHLKAFLQRELIPRIKSTGEAAIPGAAVAGPIGAGKTFIFEAVAGSLGLPVLVLKNIRSQYFGQTDVVFERLRRVLEALGKVILFVDEADTQFGGVGADAHATERRLTGKVQAMMSDPKLRGKVVWLLMTARIERLSPDIRRPGRVGDLIIPVLDSEPGSEDHRAFVQWVLKAVKLDTNSDAVAGLMDLTAGYSSAGFAALRSQLKAATVLSGKPLSMQEVTDAVHDLLPADIGPTRRVQTLQALVNCTRRSLLPDPEVDEQERAAWSRELAALNESIAR